MATRSGGNLTQYLVVAVGAAAGIILSVLFSRAVGDREQRLVDAELDRRTSVIVFALERRVNQHLRSLRAIGGLFRASSEVTKEEFATFVSTVAELGPEVVALEWIPEVSHSDRQAFEASASTDAVPFEIRQRDAAGRLVRATKRDTHYPVMFAEPPQGNQPAIGFDIGSEPTRRAAVRLAKSRRGPAATAPIQLVQDFEARPAILVLSPIYTPGDQLMGFALGVFRLRELTDEAWHKLARAGLSLRLVDVTDERTELAALSFDGGRVPFVGEPQRVRNLVVASRRWQLEVRREGSVASGEQDQLARWVLIGGVSLTLFMTTLLGVYLLRAVRRMVSARQLTREVSTAYDKLRDEVAAREDAQRALAENLEQLRRSNEDLDTFAYIASHDLRGPLRGIANLASWIDEDSGENLSDSSKEHLGLLRGRVKRLERMLRDLLQYSRAGRVDAQIESVDLRELLTEVVDEVNDSGRLVLTVPDTLPNIHTAAAPLRQVIANLISNAIKHHDRMEVAVSVNVRALEAGRWEIEVSDDGPGIDPGMFEKALTMFQTLKPRDEIETSGLGLALVKRLVESVGGDMELSSPVANDRGLAVTVHWPEHSTPEESG